MEYYFGVPDSLLLQAQWAQQNRAPYGGPYEVTQLGGNPSISALGDPSGSEDWYPMSSNPSSLKVLNTVREEGTAYGGYHSQFKYHSNHKLHLADANHDESIKQWGRPFEPYQSKRAILTPQMAAQVFAPSEYAFPHQTIARLQTPRSELRASQFPYHDYTTFGMSG